jgi:anaerobic selenocysteine-containing dehydrogenase
VAGLAAAFGSGAMTNTIGDIEQADVILITGSNTTENHPVIASVVKRAVHLKGKTLIVVDPRRIKISDFARTWLRPHLGTDVAWINGMLHVIIAENLHAKEFVESRTTGFEALKQTVAKYTPEHVEAITGIPARDLREAARLFAGAERGSILYCMGITQHTTGTDNVKSLANLAMLCGNLGIAGGGGEPSAGSEQRAGRLRHGRTAGCVFRLSESGGRSSAPADGRGLEGGKAAVICRAEGDSDDAGRPRGETQGDVYHR